VQAGREAVSYGIGRSEQDAWALRSQQRFAAAVAAGRLAAELAPIPGRDDLPGLDADECPRPGATLESLAALATVYDSPTVTSGTAPALATGAGALVLATAETAARLGARPLAMLSGWALVSGEPAAIASIPARAAREALRRAGLGLDDIDLLEINEAFAAVPLVSTHVLADGDPALAEALRERTNVNGGSIAVGHPTGATAARLVMAAVGELTRRGGGRALVSICGGIGEAAAVVVTV
jgi:acetyl-CoA C-acetyltransferase